MNDGVVVRVRGKDMVPVVPFSMLIEIVHKTHEQLAHIGSLKLRDIVSKHYWHPAIEKVCRDMFVLFALPTI